MIAESRALLSSVPEISSLHVLTLTPFFPVQNNHTDGCFVAEPLPYLSPHGVRNTVMAVSPFYQPKRSPLTAAPSQRVQYPCLPGNWGLATSGAFLFRRLLDDIRALHGGHRIDLVHAHSALPCGHAAQLIRCALNIPYVVTIHGLDAFSTSQVGRTFGKCCKRRTVQVFRQAERVLCVSRKVQERVIAGCPEARTHVIYNGVDPKLFNAAPQASHAVSVLCVGNFIPTKGQDVLLRAFAEVRKTVPDCFLKFIGGGPEECNLRRLAYQLDIAEAVTFARRQGRESVARAMRDSTIFALPSSYEGLGCVYLEAMSCSKPVIACRGQGIEEIIEHGENGYLIAPHDHRALSERIIQLVQSKELREQVGRRARRTILDGYTLDHQAEGMVEAYREACR